MISMNNIGMRLKKVREEEKLNQRDFAKKIGISQGMLSGIENGTEKFAKRTQKVVCLEFGIEEDWLLNGQGPMITPQKTPPEVPEGPDGRKMTSDELELVSTYDKLIPETQNEVLTYAKDKLELQEFREKTKTGEKGDKEKWINIPELSDAEKGGELG
ncbi:hypothetical protein AGMMS49944_09500 [Spirochaetia bacterium]|nr:hypothetical protein AGMMS49944_09500 [Spirochaetia bacterium]